MNKKEFEANVEYLGYEGLIFCGDCIWENKPFSAELEGRTDGGGDMIITLEELSKKGLQEYIDDFDINREVIMWWPDGEKGRGVPFDNIKEHYEDLEDWLKKLQGICDRMPY